MPTAATNKQLWKFYKQYRRELFTYALSITRNRARAEDALLAVAQQNGKVANVKTYVFRPIRNSALKEIENAKKSRSLDELGPDSFLQAPPQNRPDRQCQEREMGQMIARALEKIPAEQKETIVLRVYSRLKFRTIAQILHEPLGTITTRYRRGLAALAELLKEHVDEP